MLQADIQWREQYVSHALNRKFAGVIPTGIYQGFTCQANDYGLTVGDADGENTAVVEVNGYSITIRMTEPESVAPSTSAPYVVIDAYYGMGVATRASLKAVAEPAAGQLVLCKVVDTGSGWEIDESERALSRATRLDTALAEMAEAQIEAMQRHLELREKAEQDAKAAGEGAKTTARELASALHTKVDKRYAEQQAFNEQQASSNDAGTISLAQTAAAGIDTMTRQVSMLDRLLTVEKAARI